ncbi:metallophosphoesterase family protein [Roseimaritima ulvae]|uniref:Putative metallophosphoesterase YhaO n=1 Tax=Roseimaritima ulvae TaxID=980254 RepID=A0A5B9R137_9BACT|nr:DNA repair exonuclease [Roseimaritima ulvae]QEG40013.1 putative metallophosphoesterase YhaO [Roseimaritima ulvae]
MAGESFRFLHASDFHLERPMGDLDELPTHLHDALANAPWKAAEAVFEAALLENVDFVVLAGDLLNPSLAGPRGIALLVEQFENLHEQNIPVFWAAGDADDPQKWPEAITLPDNVTLFPRGQTEAVPVVRGGTTICMVVGRSSEGRSAVHVPSFRIDPTDHFTVAVATGSAEADALAEGRFDYWALGGRHQRRDIEDAARVAAVYCGSPQGRALTEPGGHGYTIVDIDSDGNGRVHHTDCDSFRYCHVKVDAAEISAAGDIRNFLSQRIARLQHEQGERHLLIGWDLSLAGGEALQAVGDPAQLLKWLRQEHGHGNPAAWTVQLAVRPPSTYPKSWHEEDTILGDFLRVTDRHRKSGGTELNLKPLTEEHPGLPSTVETLLGEPHTGARSEVLGQAALLGVELLRGGKVNLS